MKVLLLVQREGDDAWVQDAIDEYTVDANGGVPESINAKIALDPDNFRTVWVTIPDGTLESLWKSPVVEGTVAGSAKVGPHSRACGIRQHDHGPDCSQNCPTCGGIRDA